MSSSVGMMKFPTEWKNKIHVPNHQPVDECGIQQMIQPKIDETFARFDLNQAFWGTS